MSCPVCGGEVYGRGLRDRDGTLVALLPGIFCPTCKRDVEACGPKETKMDKKRWMWDGQEMEETRQPELGVYILYSKQYGCATYLAMRVAGNSVAELYANARKAGCVEVIEPVRCVCGGETLVRSTVCVPGLPWHVDCQECHMQGPAKHTKEQAIEAWNELMGKVKGVK